MNTLHVLYSIVLNPDSGSEMSVLEAWVSGVMSMVSKVPIGTYKDAFLSIF